MKKKILIIAAALSVGGAEKVARDIGLYGSSEEYEPHYVVFDTDTGAYEQQILDHGGKTFHLPSPAAGYRQYYRSLCALMKEHRYLAVHAHTMFNCGWAMLAAKRQRVPVRISHAHSALDNGNRLVKRLYEGAMRRLILRNSTHLVACGEKAGIRLFGEKAYRKRGLLILNGVDTDAFRFNAAGREKIRAELGWQDSLVIGHMGHLCGIKNQRFLLDLMPLILEKQPQAKLVLLGEGEDRAALEARIRETGLTDVVRLTGNVVNVAEYLSAMDVFAFPSLFEGMPLSILEVQANGLPCVISTGVPKDVFITDLIHPLALTEEPTRWVEEILAAKRDGTVDYARRLKDAGFDLKDAMEKIYRIYEGKVV